MTTELGTGAERNRTVETVFDMDQTMMWATGLDPDEWILHIPSELRDRAWRDSEGQGHPGGRWTAFLNRLCLASFTQLWAELEPTGAKVSPWPSLATLPSCWEFTTGTALTLGSQRIILIPTENLDDSTLTIPQEWVDIPSWAGDYYVGAQIDPPAEQLQILGYVTHQQLKARGEYDAFERDYSIETETLIAWDGFQPSYRQYQPSDTQVALPPLTPPEPVQVEPLIKRLTKPGMVIPRLALPFSLWGAMLENDTWRQQLYSARRGQATVTVTKLSNWLVGQVEQSWQSLETLLSSPQWAASRQMRSPAPAETEPTQTLGKSLLEATPLVLSVSVTALESGAFRVLLKLDPATGQRTEAVTIRLLDEANAVLSEQVTAPTEMIRLQFSAERGERFNLEVLSGNERILEQFEI